MTFRINDLGQRVSEEYVGKKTSFSPAHSPNLVYLDSTIDVPICQEYVTFHRRLSGRRSRLPLVSPQSAQGNTADPHFLLSCPQRSLQVLEVVSLRPFPIRTFLKYLHIMFGILLQSYCWGEALDKPAST